MLLLWIARAQFAAQFARAYFRQHGIESSVEIGTLGLSSASARFALGPPEAPDISADRIELHFDPLGWIPRVVEVRLVNPVVRARLDANGKLNLGSLQGWIDSLNRQQGKSRFVSDDLAVSLTGLRLLLTIPGGALEVDGDAKLVKSLPVSLALRVPSADILYQGAAVRLRAASLAFDQRAGTLAVQFSGAVKTAGLEAQGLDVRFDAQGFKWSADKALFLAMSSARLQIAAMSVTAGQAFATPKLDVVAHNVVTASDGRLDADLTATGGAGFDATLAPLRAADPALAGVIRQNLARLAVTFAGHVERRGGVTRFALTKPLLVRGAKGGALRVPALTLFGGSDRMTAALTVSLSGPGLPAASLTMRKLVWSGGGFTSDAAFAARFSFMMLHGADIAANGTLSWQGGRYAFTPNGCARAVLAAFHPGASDLAKDVRGAICANQGPLVTGEGAHWKLSGEARDASADLPLANVHAEKVAARLAFEGKGAPLKGLATITAGQVSDRATSTRFKPLLGTGTAALEGGVWRGRFAMTDRKGNALGAATYTHAMATGAGAAHIDAPHIVFAPNHQQPADLSPLLVGLRSAEGTAAFAGDINWTRQAITSQGKLSIATLDFMTVLGKAHAVKSEIVFTSLLPPATASGQGLTISRIDWTIPFSAVDVRFT
ncbi:MAG TPA: hypothetical protein VNY75_11005, partial [Rhizomicrobium sp.]|nr:hypothetical protein [Rhizomicrobium sp.]